MNLSEQYRKMHERGHFMGLSCLHHTDRILGLIKEYDAKTLLDYGCGQGFQYIKHKVHEKWGINPDKYDPYYPPYARKPENKYDGVICTDVLEHVPEEDVDKVLSDIINYSNKFVFLTICTREALKKLPDGRNCHLTVKPKEWWLARINALKSHRDVTTEFVDD